MLIDGEKYACEACVRGHRVSNCQHTNRPLQHINKKGRPVSQCAHCRSLRKSRAAHVKCDCGEKTSKCAHLQPTVEGHRETCCCNHGGRCTCALKKENPLDPVPESDSDDAGTQASSISAGKMPVRRRRAATVHSSDPRGLHFDQHGHHKASKHNRASQKCEPYTLSRVNSISGVSGIGLGTEPPLFRAGGNDLVCETREQRQIKSETASPLMVSSRFAQLGSSHVPPLDLSRLDYSFSHYDMFSNPSNSSDHEAPLFSASLSTASVDWNAYDIGEANGESFTPSSYSQAGTQSFSGTLDFGSGSEQLPHLANTASNSGNVSEVEDFLPNGDGDLELDTFGMGGNAFLRHGTAANPAADISSIEYSNFFKNDDSQFSAGAVSMVEEDPAFWMPNYNDGIATVGDSSDEVGPSTIASFWDV